MRGAIRKMIQPILWKLYRLYLSKKRWYHYDGLKVCIYPSVFHPGLLLSTKLLLNFIKNEDIKGRKILELGAGSGLISLWLCRAGAICFASDINPESLRSIRESCVENDLSLQTIHSDLFDRIDENSFDYILINPPFYPKKPNDNREAAFFCGEDFQYFEKLFSQLPSFLLPGNQSFMILSDDVEIETIGLIATHHSLRLTEKTSFSKMGEKHTIYRIELNPKTVVVEE